MFKDNTEGQDLRCNGLTRLVSFTIRKIEKGTVENRALFLSVLIGTLSLWHVEFDDPERGALRIRDHSKATGAGYIHRR